MAAYEYTPLDKERSEIRLITLLPPRFGREIHIKLETTVLSDSRIPQYQALSYTWGSEDNPVRIWVEGARGRSSSLDVTRDLEEALQHLRYNNGRSRKLWIDAICISQQDIPERNHQVARMADIYSNATRVIVWLGPKRDGSGIAIEALKALGSEVEVNWSTMKITPLYGEGYDDWKERPLPFAHDHDILDSIAHLLDRSWFTRLWIWQEVRLARKEAKLLCGSDVMSWNDFRSAVLCLQDKAAFTFGDLLSDGLARVIRIITYVDETHPWDEILDQTRKCLCSNDKDRVYAVLNLADPYDSSDLEPDYSKSTVEVYKGLFKHNLKVTQELTLLSQCELDANKMKDLPSWVPDLSRPRKCDSLWGPNAAPMSRAHAHTDVHNDRVLVVTGLCVGRLCKIETIPSRADKSPQAWEAWRTTLAQQFVKPKLEQWPHVKGISTIEALCRTLCCNHLSEIRLPPMPYPDFKKSEESLIGLVNGATKSNVYEPYLTEVLNVTEGRVFFITKEGYIGLAPDTIEPQDQVCVLLGCLTPLVLRPDGFGNYQVVGECYIHGLMDGAAFLGPMPSNWRLVMRYSPDTNNGDWVSINDATGETRIEDPRLGGIPPPSGWRVERHTDENEYTWVSNHDTEEIGEWYDPRIPEVLRERGVHLQEFRLV